MYSNAIQKLWVVKRRTVAARYADSLEALPPFFFKSFKFELDFDMQEFGFLLSLFVCL